MVSLESVSTAEEKPIITLKKNGCQSVGSTAEKNSNH